MAMPILLDGVGAGSALIDRGGDTRMDPGIIRRQAEGRHPFEDMDVEIDPPRCQQLAIELDHLPCM